MLISFYTQVDPDIKLVDPDTSGHIKAEDVTVTYNKEETVEILDSNNGTNEKSDNDNEKDKVATNDNIDNDN